MITISAHKDGLLEKRSLPFLPTLYPSLSPLPPSRDSFPDSPSRSARASVCLSLSRSLGVMTAGRQRVRKLECCVLTGVRGMLTGEQTEGTDGSVTCPRSSDMPLPGALDLKPNTFMPASFVFL